MTRDIERGTRGVHSLISYSLYSIIPTLIEVTVVLTLLAVKFDAWFAWITLSALVIYITFTITVTNWRTQFRKQMNEFDSTAHSKAIDSLLNFETGALPGHCISKIDGPQDGRQHANIGFGAGDDHPVNSLFLQQMP